MNKYLKVIIAFVLLVGGTYVTWQYYLDEFLVVLKGSVFPLLTIIGLLMVWIVADEFR